MTEAFLMGFLGGLVPLGGFLAVHTYKWLRLRAKRRREAQRAVDDYLARMKGGTDETSRTD